MISLDKALQIATEYSHANGSPDITKVLEHHDFWIIYGGIKGVRLVGSHGISINKDSGELKTFHLPDDDNFEILEHSKSIDFDLLLK